MQSSQHLSIPDCHYTGSSQENFGSSLKQYEFYSSSEPEHGSSRTRFHQPDVNHYVHHPSCEGIDQEFSNSSRIEDQLALLWSQARVNDRHEGCEASGGSSLVEVPVEGYAYDEVYDLLFNDTDENVEGETDLPMSSDTDLVSQKCKSDSSTRHKTAAQRPRSAFVQSLGSEWRKYIPLYMKADRHITRSQARHRIYTKLDANIAAMLRSSDERQLQEAACLLARRGGNSDINVDLQTRLNVRLREYFGASSHIETIRRFTRIGLPLFPEERLEELDSTDRRVYGPAFELLRKLALKAIANRRNRLGKVRL